MKKILLAFLCLPALSWASFQPVSGSTVTIVPSGSASIPVSGTLSVNALPTSTNNIGTVTGSSVTIFAPNNNVTPIPISGTLWPVSQPVVSTNTWNIVALSYSASTDTLKSVASATDIAELCGNPNNTTLVYDLRASCTQTTAGTVLVQVIKRSGIDVGVIGTTVTAVANDSNYAVAQSSVAAYVANPTAGATVGIIDTYQLGCIATGTASPNDVYISPSSWKTKPIVLRSATQCLAFNLNGVTVTGGLWNISYSWIETTSP